LWRYPPQDHRTVQTSALSFCDITTSSQDCTSVFQHPAKGVFRYSFQASSIDAEIQHAKRVDGHSVFGKFLYSRHVRQVPMRVGARYELKPCFNGATLAYRLVDEVLFGQFDYFSAVGAHSDRVYLLVESDAPVPGLDVSAKLSLKLELVGTRTHKFMDLCKGHVFEVKFSAGQARLLGYRSAGDADPSISILLNIVGSH